MKAIICNQFGPIDEIDHTEIPDPQVGPGQVILTNKAIGVNFPDGLLIQGLYQHKPERPFTPGMEVAGVDGFKLGDRVFATVQIGGYAEKLCVEATTVMMIPIAMSDEHAAVLPIAFGTAHYALKHRACRSADRQGNEGQSYRRLLQ